MCHADLLTLEQIARQYFPPRYYTTCGWEAAEKWEVMIHGINNGEQTRGGGPPL